MDLVTQHRSCYCLTMAKYWMRDYYVAETILTVCPDIAKLRESVTDATVDLVISCTPKCYTDECTRATHMGEYFIYACCCSVATYIVRYTKSARSKRVHGSNKYPESIAWLLYFMSWQHLKSYQGRH